MNKLSLVDLADQVLTDVDEEFQDKAREYFAPMQEKYDAYKANTALLEEVLQHGAARARAIAEPVIERVREAVGLPRK